MIIVKMLHPHAAELVGFIPTFLDERDERPAAEQLDTGYQHGGGWRPLAGWNFHHRSDTIKYPGDPALRPVAEMWLREERILVYEHAWVAIVQPDGSYLVARMD